MRILSVEDEDTVARAIRAILATGLGAEVDLASDCSSAREHLSSRRYDLVTLDYRLPDGDGLSLLEEVRRAAEAPPVILITARGDERTAARAFKLGASGYVVKDGKMSETLLDEARSVIAEAARERAEEALRQSEARYRLIAENITDTVWLMDLDLKTKWISPSTGRSRGFTLEELSRMPLERNVTPESAAAAMEALDEMLAPETLADSDGEVSANLELEFYRKDGSTCWVETELKLLRDAGGNPTGLLAVGHDVTGRREAEETLRQSEERYRFIVDNITDVIMTRDMELNITYISPSIERLSGYTVEEARELTLADTFTPESVERSIKMLVEELERESDPGADPDRTAMLLLESKHKDGSTVWVENQMRFLRDEEGKATGILAVIRDVSDRKRWEEDLKRINGELAGYAHVVSHDLKGPLSAVVTAAEILSEILESDCREILEGDAGIALRNINDGASRAMGLATDLLVLAEAGHEPPEKQPVPVEVVVRSILRENGALLEERGMVAEVDGDLGVAYMDPTHVYQVFSNLIGNAVKFNVSENPRLSVATLGGTDPGRLAYLVRDNGPGIPEGCLEEFLLPFRKGPNSTDSGIGLSIVDRVVMLYGGEIRAYNDGGACFEFTLPEYVEGG